MKSLIILTPSKGQVCIEQRDMLMRLAVRMTKLGHKLVTCDDCTAGFLHHSRNLLLAKLESVKDQYTWGLWLDSDTSFDPDAVLRIIERDGPEEMVVWNYPKRLALDVFNPPQGHDVWAKHIREMGGIGWTSSPAVTPQGGLVWSEDKKLIKMTQCAFGAVMMRPSVAVKMKAAYPQPKLDWVGRVVIPAFNLLDDTVGEDYSFTRRWVGMGGEMWCEPSTFINNGQSGGRYSDEIAKNEELQMTVGPMFAVAV